MKIDKSKVKIRRIGMSKIPVLVEYRLAYLAELQGEKNEMYKNKLKFGFAEPVYPYLELVINTDNFSH